MEHICSIVGRPGKSLPICIFGGTWLLLALLALNGSMLCCTDGNRIGPRLDDEVAFHRKYAAFQHNIYTVYDTAVSYVC